MKHKTRSLFRTVHVFLQIYERIFEDAADSLRNLAKKPIFGVWVKRLIVIGFLGGSMSAAAGAAVVFFYIYLPLKKTFPEIKKLHNYKYSAPVPTKVYDRNNLLIAEFFKEKREILDYSEIPLYVYQALIAMEDNHFYSHHGVDFIGIGRAAVQNVLAGRIVSGGSTITQQLSKLMFTNRSRTFTRKFKELFYALQIERMYTKEQILSMYCNQIFLGHGTYGVQGAAKVYFKKNASEMTVAESSLLATLPTAPNYYSPFRHPNESRRKHLTVLRRMAELGFIPRSQYKRIHAEFWQKFTQELQTPSVSAWKQRVNKTPYFTEYIWKKLVKEFGREKVLNGGLKVYTTLDLKAQLAGQKAMQKAIYKQNNHYRQFGDKASRYFNSKLVDQAELFDLVFGGTDQSIGQLKAKFRLQSYLRNRIADTLDAVSLFANTGRINDWISDFREMDKVNIPKESIEGALVSIEPNTGFIVSMIGGSHFSPQNRLNRVYQMKRQPGSAFKPFVYLQAMISRRYTTASVMDDDEKTYQNDDGSEWNPQNYSGKQYGRLRLRQALKHSVNVITVKLMENVGVMPTLRTAANLLHVNIRDRFPKQNLSYALGTCEVTPLELARAYAVIANQGRSVTPRTIRYILDRQGNYVPNLYSQHDGTSYYWKPVDAKGHVMIRLRRQRKDVKYAEIVTRRLIPRSATFLITDMLKDVLNRGGTAYGAVRGSGFVRPAAGKTGTTQNWRDAWFAGFTPQLATVVWLGFDKHNLSLGVHQAGGDIAAPVWARYMLTALRGKPSRTLMGPTENIVTKRVCARSGKLPSSSCSEFVDREYFIRGTEPTEECRTCAYGYIDNKADKKEKRKERIRHDFDFSH